MPAKESHESKELRIYMESLATATDLELVVNAAAWKDGTAKNRAILMELERRAKRREQQIAWVAIGISVASLIVAMFAAWHSHWGSACGL